MEWKWEEMFTVVLVGFIWIHKCSPLSSSTEHGLVFSLAETNLCVVYCSYVYMYLQYTNVTAVTLHHINPNPKESILMASPKKAKWSSKSSDNNSAGIRDK